MQVFPPGADNVAESFEHFLMMDWDKASLFVHTFLDICDPQHTNLDADNAYELCLLFLISNVMRH
jgi:hypothetical protein